MSAATAIRRWESTSDPSRWGVEITGFAPLTHRLEAELDRRIGELSPGRPAFVFTALGSTHTDELAVAVSRASDFSSGARICIALDQESLLAMNPDSLRNRNVGILLDQVDSNTPLSAVSRDLIEALRFDESFVHLARTDARLACILDAMLRLAHDLGLATLAPYEPHEGMASGFEFDYVSAPTAKR